MSWPSMTIACQPKARQRRANCSMSCCHMVARLWPRPLTSVMPHRLSSPSIAATSAASQTEPSADSPSPSRHVGAVVGLDPPRVQGDADRGADALAERAGRDVDKRQPRRRVSFEIRADLAQLQQLGAIERARFGPRGVQNRRRVPFRQHEAIAARDDAGPSDRTASRRKTAPPPDPPPSSSWSDGRCRPPTSTAPSRCAAGWRCSSRAGMSVARSKETSETSVRFRMQISDCRIDVALNRESLGESAI